MRRTNSSDSTSVPGSMWLNRRSSENTPVRIRLGGSLTGCGGTRSISITILARLADSEGGGPRRPPRNVEISKEENAEAGPCTAGSRTSQICCPQHPHIRERATNVRSCHQRLRRLVLLRAAPGLQSHRGPEIPDSPGTERVRSEHHQSAPGGGTPRG